MFRSAFRQFEDDPFFSGQRDRMRSVFDMPTTFPHPFEDFGHPALDATTRRADGRDRPTRQRHAGSRTRQRHAGSREVAPIDMFGSMFQDMRSMFDRMERNFDTTANDPNAYSYSSSTVMSYKNDGHGEPKYYKAAKSTKRAPGGVKETQRFVQDSDTGIHKMAIGHHLGDRAHIMERALNRRTNEEERHENYHNMDQSDAEAFQQEWRQRTQQPTRSLGPTGSRSVPDVRRRDFPPQARAALNSHAAGRPPRTDYDVRDGDSRKPRDRRVRLDSRPTNKHSPRGGL